MEVFIKINQNNTIYVTRKVKRKASLCIGQNFRG